jgi:hypothetical protein
MTTPTELENLPAGEEFPDGIYPLATIWHLQDGVEQLMGGLHHTLEKLSQLEHEVDTLYRERDEKLKELKKAMEAFFAPSRDEL